MSLGRAGHGLVATLDGHALAVGGRLYVNGSPVATGPFLLELYTPDP